MDIVLKQNSTRNRINIDSNCFVSEREKRGERRREKAEEKEGGKGRERQRQRENMDSLKQEIKTVQEINSQRHYIKHIKIKSMLIEVKDKIKIKLYTVLIRNLLVVRPWGNQGCIWPQMQR